MQSSGKHDLTIQNYKTHQKTNNHEKKSAKTRNQVLQDFSNQKYQIKNTKLECTKEACGEPKVKIWKKKITLMMEENTRRKIS